MKIESSVALVSGANRGLGQALVNALLARGAKKVYAAARNLPSLEHAHYDDRSRVVPIQLDLTSSASVEAAASEAKDVNLLINNAGVLGAYNLLTSPLADIQSDFTTNSLGTLQVIRALLPVLEKNKGTVVNVLSIASFAGMAGLGGYAGSKAASHSFTQSLRADLAKRGVQVLAAYPGPIDTEMVRAIEMPKTGPVEVAENLLAGVEAGEEEIAPDGMAKTVLAKFQVSPKDVERMFASM